MLLLKIRVLYVLVTHYVFDFQLLTSEVKRPESGVRNTACGKTGPGWKCSFWSQKGSFEGGTNSIEMYMRFLILRMKVEVCVNFHALCLKEEQVFSKIFF